MTYARARARTGDETSDATLFEKGRSLHGDDAKPFEAKLEIRDGAPQWTLRDIEDVELARASALFADDYSVREVADEIGVSKSKAGRLRKAAVERGLLDD